LIARVWDKAVPASRGSEYLTFLRTSALRECIAKPGNRGGWCMHRVARDESHFHLMTLWDDIDAATLGTDRLLIEENTRVQDYSVRVANSPARQSERPAVSGGNAMARLWRGFVPLSKADAYLDYLSGFGFRDYEVYPGFCGAHLLHRTENATMEVIFLSFWNSWESIAAYAGSDPEKACYYAYDLECLIDPAANVEHYQVLA
jgi:heme-degrading monooxygenase HmoA